MMSIPLPQRYFYFALLIFAITNSKSQNFWKEKQGYSLEFGNVKTWPGIIDILSPEKKIYLFDEHIFQGHSNFVLRSLKRKVSFHTFKDLVKFPEKRAYIPFYLLDLREKNFIYESKKINWAIKISDYVLEDDKIQLVKLISETFQRCADYMRLQDATCGEGIFLLSNADNATPNVKILESVKQAGVPVCDYRTLYAGINYQIQTTTVLNSGTATGYIRYITKNNEKQYGNDENAIYVFEQTPERVPLAAAIITLQPQTLLSHINLLAINRNTPNLSTADQKLIQQLKSWQDSLITLRCTSEPEHSCKLTRTNSLPEKLNELKERIHLTTIDLSVINIVSLDDSLHNKLEQVGSKAANYAVLQKHFPRYVKKAHAIPFSFFQSVMQTQAVDSLISRYCENKTQDEKIRNELRAQIRSAIMEAAIPNEKIKQVADLQKNIFKNKKMRVRSSTNCEDLPGFNGAGLYLSKAIKPFEQPKDVEKKLLMVFASLWNDNACGEREFFGIDHREASMAVLCNEAFENEWANGVALVLPDAESDKLSLIIDAQPGEHEVTNPAPGDVPEELFFQDANINTFTITSRSKYGKVLHGLAFTKNTSDELRVLSLQIDQVLKQYLPADKKKHFGTDIEFKIMNETGRAKIWIKQARLLQLKNNQ
jgi:hypothetical protein